MTEMDSPVKSATPAPTNNDLESPLDRFYFWEEHQPNKVYLSQPFGDGNIVNYRWSRVANEARRMACYLRSLQLAPGSRIAIMSKNCAHWIMADLAIWLSGNISVPIYPNLAADTVNQILTHSDVRVLFVGKLDAWESMARGVPEGVHCIAFPLSPPTPFTRWEDIIATTPAFMGKPRVNLDDIATIIYTSGTTGTPKGVVHSFRTIAAAATNASTVYAISSEDRVLSYLPLAHVAERMLVEVASLYNAFTVYFAESLDTFAQDLQRARPTIFFSVPRLWSKFYQKVNEKMPAKRLELLLKIPFVSGFIKRKIKKTLGLEKARFLVSGAAPLSPALLEWYKKLGMEILEVYGMTENMGYSHATRVGDVKIGAVGKPNPGVQVRISEHGEIQIKSPTNMLGYFKEPEKTAEAFTQDGYFRTGDRGEVDAQGHLRITGRTKEIFKTSKGKYVAPAPIENRLGANEFIEQVCVVGDSLPQPVALVMLAEHLRQKLDESLRERITRELAQLHTHVNTRLDPHEQLQCIVVVKQEWTIENGVMTPTLKIKRNVIESTYRYGLDQWGESRHPVIWE